MSRLFRYGIQFLSYKYVAYTYIRESGSPQVKEYKTWILPSTEQSFLYGKVNSVGGVVDSVHALDMIWQCDYN